VDRLIHSWVNTLLASHSVSIISGTREEVDPLKKFFSEKNHQMVQGLKDSESAVNQSENLLHFNSVVLLLIFGL
jgi:hypothetical protein